MDEEKLKAKARVNLLRRKAARQGYALRKTRRVDRDAKDYGSYTLIPEKGTPRTFASAEEVEAFLFREEQRPTT